MRGSRLSAGIVASVAITLLLSSVAHAAALKKLYTANISPANPPVTAGQSEVFNMTITNQATSQQLGSCNVTLPSTVTGISATNPSTGTATVVGQVIQLRNLSIPPMGLPNNSRSFTFTATSPAAGSYAATIDCRQANNYSPDQPSNKFTLDAANSNLAWTAVSPIPNADLQVVTSSVMPSGSIDGGNTQQYILRVTNNGPAGSGATVTFTDSVSSLGSITYINGGTDWTTCGGSGQTANCTRNALEVGQSATVEVRVLVSSVSSPGQLTNTASVSQSAQSNDPTPANNSSVTTTTVNPGSSSGSGYIDNVTGGSVMTEPFATPLNRFVALVTFPGLEGATAGGYVYSMNQTTETCPLLPCNFALYIDPIGVAYDNPATEGVRLKIKCDVSVCPGSSTAIQIFVRDESGNQKVMFNCFIAGIVDPNPCVDSVERLTGGQDQGDLAVSMLFLAGDPKVAGIQF
jgi:hypothetical protein